jgi:sortase A
MKVIIAGFCAAHGNLSPDSRNRSGGYAGKTSRTSLLWIRGALLIVGVLALAYAGFELLDAKLFQASQVRQFQQQLSNIRPAMATAGANSAVSAAALSGGTLGEIEIARLGVAAMILEGTDERTLRHAVGHIAGTPFPGQSGNVGIAGHRDTFFRALRNVQHGDEITLTTLNGSYLYDVDTTQIVGPKDTQVLNDSKESILTLVTCYPFYFVGPSPKRFIVRAHKISR